MIALLALLLLGQPVPGACGNGSNPCSVVSLKTAPVAYGALPLCSMQLRGTERMTTDAGYVYCDNSDAGTSVAWTLFASGGGTTYTGTAPIAVTGTVISCVPASGVADGCLTTGSQDIGGTKTFKAAQVFEGYLSAQGQFPRTIAGETAYVSQIDYYGIMVGSGPIVNTYDGEGLTFQNRRAGDSVSPGTLLRSALYRDAGSYFSINSGLPCDSTIFDVSANGDVTFGPPANLPGCTSTTSLVDGVLTPGNPVSGQIALQSYQKLYLSIRGRLADNHDAIQTDGGKPAVDGGYWIQTEPDGGTYFAYAGSHGSLSVVTPQHQKGSWLMSLSNPGSDGGVAWGNDVKFTVDSVGAFGATGIALANFPVCPAWSFQTTLGQYSVGAAAGALLYATDTAAYYRCGASGWVKQLSTGDALTNYYRTYSSFCPTADATGCLAEESNFYGPIRTTGGESSGCRLSANWRVPGIDPTPGTGVVARIYNVDDATSVCTCTLGACTTASGDPLSCACTGTLTADRLHTIRLATTTDCDTNPTDITVTAECFY